MSEGARIIYDKHNTIHLDEFGIDIPVRNTTTRTFEKLVAAHPLLKKTLADWHIESVEGEITREDLLRVHAPEYIERLFSARLEDEIISTFELINDEGEYHRYNPRKARRPLTDLFGLLLRRVAGTWQCCKVALDKGFCFYFGGGMHHAQRDRGQGFCLLNDIVIAIRKLQAEKEIATAWVIDVDAHKGDGTAALTSGDGSVSTLSAHMARGWPLDGPRVDSSGRPNPSFVPSDLDIPIAEGEEHLYLKKLKEGLESLGQRPRPDLAIVVSGADPYEKDELPSAQLLKLSLAQLRERDLLIYEFLQESNIPQAYLMAGGYGDHAWEVYAQFLEWVLVNRLASLDRHAGR